MKVAYFPNQTALQSEPVWQSFLTGLKTLGHEPVENTLDADAAVIWSVLWYGRMKSNQQVYEHYRAQGKPVFIIEVGTLKRGTTWKVSLNHITSEGLYPNSHTLDLDRPSKLGVSLFPVRADARSSILIATQHQHSLQWANLPSIEQWVDTTIQNLRLYTDRQILVRQHPRFPIRLKNYKNVSVSIPNKLPNTYDEYDISYNHHCVVNYCSGPSIQAPIRGIPIICDRSSLAFPVSSRLRDIESPKIPNREEWFIKICHTEWTIDEISQGIPQKYLINQLTL